MSDRLSTITCCCGFDVPARTDALSCPRCGADLRPLQLLREIPLRLHDETHRPNAAGRPFEARRPGAALVPGPEFAEARLLLANLPLNAGDRTRAEYEARAGLVLDPGHEKLKRILADAEAGGRPPASRIRNSWNTKWAE